MACNSGIYLMALAGFHLLEGVGKSWYLFQICRGFKQSVRTTSSRSAQGESIHVQTRDHFKGLGGTGRSRSGTNAELGARGASSRTRGAPSAKPNAVARGMGGAHHGDSPADGDDQGRDLRGSNFGVRQLRGGPGNQSIRSPASLRAQPV